METKIQSHKETNDTKIFLSYCSMDEDIANIVEKSITSRIPGIKISRYTRDVGYKESFKKFMKTVGSHDFVITIVSDRYLKSSACMYEVGELIKDNNFKEKILFIILSDKDKSYYRNAINGDIEAGIYDHIKRTQYTLYWQNKHKEFKKNIKKISSKVARKESKESLKEIKKIMDYDLGVFLSYLKDSNGKSLTELIATEFSPIIREIERKKPEETPPVDPEGVNQPPPPKPRVLKVLAVLGIAVILVIVLIVIVTSNGTSYVPGVEQYMEEIEPEPPPERPPEEELSPREMFFRGENYLQERNYGLAYSWIMRAADLGYLNAQRTLGWMYQNGRGPDADNRQALYWYERAVNQGCVRSPTYLGWLYLNGSDVRDYDRAMHWYMSGAYHGCEQAELGIGLMYELGRGVEQSYIRAVEWYRRSADRGCARSKTYIGMFYALGRGLEQCLDEAYYWLESAANLGNYTAIEWVAYLRQGTMPDWAR